MNINGKLGINALRPLGQVGRTGFVLHSGRESQGSYAYYPDNDQESWRKAFPVSRDRVLGDTGLTANELETLVTYRVPVAVLPSKGGPQPQIVFANLDAFQDLKDADPQSAQGYPLIPAERSATLPDTFDALVIQDGGQYFEIPKAKFQPLNQLDAGEAKVVVRRGAVAAAIPNNQLPIGTNCVLINLKEILPATSAARTTSAAPPRPGE